jgi:tetratricopeptide (TPR) repeat protein
MESPFPPSWIAWFRRHERKAAVIWVVFTLAVIAAVLYAPARVRILDAIEVAADERHAAWISRLEEGDRLVAAGRHEEAVAYLSALDSVFPARHARYGLDKEREHLLRQLARSQEAVGMRGRTIDTWLRLVAFDTLNYRNHFGYAQAAERLLSGWALAPEAKDGYAKALLVFPSHLPSLRGYIDSYMDRGEFIPVRTAYRTYLDAFLLEPFSVRAGDAAVETSALVDGLPHDFDLAFPVSAGWKGDLVIGSPVFPISVERIAMLPAVTAGKAAPRVSRELNIADLAASRMVKSGAGWVPEDSTGSLRIPIDAGPDGVARVSIRVRMFKLMDPALWAMAAKSHRNLLDLPGRDSAAARTAPYPSPDAADAAFERLEWATQGRYVPANAAGSSRQ